MSPLPVRNRSQSPELSSLNLKSIPELDYKVTAAGYILAASLAMAAWLYLLSRGVWSAAVWLAS